MQGEYTINTSTKVLLWIVIAVFGISSLVLLLAAIRNPILILPSLMCLGLCALMANQLSRKIVVTNESIVFTSLFTRREILINDIRGYRVSKVYALESKSKPVFKIYLNATDYTGIEELNNWIRATFPNLDKLDHQAELAELLADPTLGNTTSERQSVLDKANQLAIVYNVFVVFIALANLMAGNAFIVGMAILYPLAGVPFVWASGGLIRVVPSSNSPRYSLFIGLLAGLAVLFIRVVAGGETMYNGTFWNVFIIIAILFGALYYFTGGSKRDQFPHAITLLVLGAIYGFLAVSQLNITYDNSESKTYTATVLDHYIQQSKGTHHYITISAWGQKTTTENVEVSSEAYSRDTIGSTVTIKAKKGLLNIPWYVVNY